MSAITQKNHIVEIPFQCPISPAKSSTSSYSFPLGTSYGPKIDTVLRLRQEIAIAQQNDDLRFAFVDCPDAFAFLPQEVFEFLAEHSPDFFSSWRRLKELHEKARSPEAFLSDWQVTHYCEKAQEAIRHAFLNAEKTPWDLRFSEWAEDYPHALFAVRSSAIKGEDGKISNAGGNLTLSYIRKENVFKACGEVIASHYSLRSITNIIRGGGNPFEIVELTLGIQQVIGEPMGGEPNAALIPVSGVLLTNEPLFTGSEKFRVMRITAVIGHGEAAVSNQGIPCETFYVLQSKKEPRALYIIEESAYKTHRLAPQDGKLGFMINPEELVKAPTLDRETVERLFHLALALEIDGNPSDIEFVIKRKDETSEKPVIHIVQRRPVNRKMGAPPSYIDLRATQCAKVFKMEVQIPGHLQATAVDDFSRILFCDFLEEALEAFVPGAFDLVVIKCLEQRNSHPVMNFSEWGIPVFVSNQEIESHEIGEVTLFSPQQGIIVQGLADQIALKRGVIEHPAPMNPGNLEKLPQFPIKPEIRLRLDQLLEELVAKEVVAASSSSFPQRKVLQEAVGWRGFKDQVRQAKGLSTQAVRLQQKVREAGREFEAISLSVSGPLEKLFYAKAFRTLLSEGAFSVASLTQVLDETLLFEKEGGDQRLSEHLITATLEPEVRAFWSAFLLELSREASEEQMQAFVQLLNVLGDLKPMWISFYVEPKRAQSSLERLEALLAEFDPISMRLIEDLKDKPLQFYDEGIIARLKVAPPQIKVIALFYFSEAVGHYDDQLKALKMENLPTNVRILRFSENLEPYFNLMCLVAEELIGEGQFYFPVAREMQDGPLQSGTLEVYLSILRRAKAEMSQRYNDESLLLPSARFNVAAAKLGAGTNSTRERPRTLEDLFTLTHQNLLACVGYLYQQHLPSLSAITVSPLVQECVMRVENQLVVGHKVQLTSVEQRDSELILEYTIPQRNHSSTCQIRYKEGKIAFEAQMLGDARTRWRSAAVLVQVLNWAQVIPKAEVRCHGNVLKLVFPVESSEEMDQIVLSLKLIYGLSLYGVRSTRDPELFKAFQDQLDILIEKAHAMPNLENLSVAMEILRVNAQGDRRLLTFVQRYYQHPNTNIQEECVKILRSLSEHLEERGEVYEALCDFTRLFLESSNADLKKIAQDAIPHLFPKNQAELEQFIQTFFSIENFASQAFEQFRCMYEETFNADHLQERRKRFNCAPKTWYFFESLTRSEEVKLESIVSYMEYILSRGISNEELQNPQFNAALEVLHRSGQSRLLLDFIHKILKANYLQFKQGNQTISSFRTQFLELDTFPLICRLLAETAGREGISTNWSACFQMITLHYDRQIKEEGCKILKSAIEFGASSESILACSQALLPHADSYETNPIIFELIDFLIEQKRAEIASLLLNQMAQSPHLYEHCQKRFMALVRQGEGYGAAIAFMRYSLASQGYWKDDLFPLIEALLNQGQTDLVLQFVIDCLPFKYDSINRLLNRLVEHQEFAEKIAPVMIAQAQASPTYNVYQDTNLTKLFSVSNPTPELLEQLSTLVRLDVYSSEEAYMIFLRKAMKSKEELPNLLAVTHDLCSAFQEQRNVVATLSLVALILEYKLPCPLDPQQIYSLVKRVTMTEFNFSKMTALQQLVDQLIANAFDLSLFTNGLTEIVRASEQSKNITAFFLLEKLISGSEATPDLLASIPFLLSLKINSLTKACFSVLEKASRQSESEELIALLLRQAQEQGDHYAILHCCGFLLRHDLPSTEDLYFLFDAAAETHLEKVALENREYVMNASHIENKEEEIQRRMKEAFGQVRNVIAPEEQILSHLPRFASLLEKYSQ